MPRGNNIALIMSSLGKTQTDILTPLDVADLDTRINVTSRNWVDTVKTIEDIFDCVGEEIVTKEVTRILRRLPIEGEFVVKHCLPLVALAYGVAASPTGGSPANKVVTVTVENATGGSYTLSLDFDGINQTTVNIPYDATAAKFKSIIEQLDNIGFGNTIVTLNAGVYEIEFIGKRAYSNIPLFTENITNLEGVGADVTVAQDTAGANKTHNITELPKGVYAQPKTTFGIAFEDESGSERLIVGASIENFVATAPANNGKVTFTADIVARDLIVEPGLIIPECETNTKPVRTADCLLTRNSVDLTDTLTDFQYSFNNNTLSGNTAFTGRGVKMSRIERANQRTRSLSYGQNGASEAVTASLYEEALTNPEADVKRATSLRIGTDGENITVNIPNGLTELATGSGGVVFDGESEEAINRYVDTPTKQGATAPTNIVAKYLETGTYLTPAS